MKKILNYIDSVRQELSKVVWPKKEEVIKLTVIIFIISGTVALYLGSIDYGLTKLFGVLIAR